MSAPEQVPRSGRRKTIDDLTLGQRVDLWVDLVDTCEELLKAGLRREVGPTGDWRAAYRAWYAGRMAEHEQTIRRMLERMNAARVSHAR